jgi:hypothetical protein
MFYWFHDLNFADYLHWFGLHFAAIVIKLPSVGLIILSTLHQAMVYYALGCDILDFFWVWSLDIFSNTVPSTNNVQTVIYVL